MLSVEQLEQVSKYRAGELSDPERLAVERDLLSTDEGQRALRQLEELDVLSLGMNDGDAALSSRVLERMAPSTTSRPAWAISVLAASMAAVVALGLYYAYGQHRATEVRAERLALSADAGTPPDRRVSARTPRRDIRPGQRLIAESDAVLTSESGDWLLLAGTSLVRLDDAWSLERGAVLVREAATINRQKISAPALVSVDPENLSQHVTRVEALTLSNEERDAMKTNQWKTVAGLSILLLSVAVEAKTPVPETATPPAPKPMVDLDAINRAVLPRSGAIAQCYEAGLKANPKLAGSLPMRLRMKRDGAFTRLEYVDMAADYTVENPFVASCVMKQMLQVQLPAITEERLELMYALKFEQRGEPVGVQVVLPKGDALQTVMMHDRSGKVPVDLAGSPVLGPSTARVTVVLFSASNCEFCLDAVKTVRELEQHYGTKVRFVYKHRVLPSQPESRLSAVAAQAAAEQGKFWEFIEKTYDEKPMTPEQLEQVASELRLDINAWRLARDGQKAAAQVDADLEQGAKLGVKGIPTWIIDGKELVGARPIGVLRREIDAALAKP